MFRAQSKEDKAFITDMLVREKKDFVADVMKARGKSFEDKGLTKKQLDDIFVKENFFCSDEAVGLGLADRVETFEEFKERVFHEKVKVTEVKIDRDDDFDFGALEFTTRR
jgi:ClpP class serine protease